MKKLTQTFIKLVVVVLFLTSANNSFSQATIDLSPFYGWQMNGRIKFYEGELKTDDNPLFGVTMDVLLAPGMGLRFLYSRTETTSYFKSYGSGFIDNSYNIVNEYYQIGSIKSIVNGNIEPFGAFTLGAARFHPLDAVQTDDVWRFSITAGLGVKIFFTEKIGLKLQGDFMMPMYFQGVGFYFGGGGSGLTVNGSVPLLQGNFNAGLVFRLGQ